MKTKYKILSIAAVLATLSTAPAYGHGNGCFLDENGAPNPVLSFREAFSAHNSVKKAHSMYSMTKYNFFA